MFINLHHRGLVSTSVTIIRSGENCHDILFMRPCVSFHDKLVSSADEFKPIRMIESFRDVLAEGVTCFFENFGRDFVSWVIL